MPGIKLPRQTNEVAKTALIAETTVRAYAKKPKNIPNNSIVVRIRVRVVPSCLIDTYPATKDRTTNRYVKRIIIFPPGKLEFQSF